MDINLWANDSLVLNNMDDRTGTFFHRDHEHTDILDVNDEFKGELMSYTCFQVLFCILGIAGNVLIIYVYKAKLHKKREGRFFIILLAVVDLFHCIVSSTFVFVKNLRPLTFPDKWTCKILIYGTNWLFILSLFVLFLICLERYWKICRPLANQFTKKLKFSISIFMTIFAGVIPIPRIVYFEVRTIDLGNLTGNVCGPNMEITGADIVIPGVLYFNFILSGIVIVILAVLYSLVGRVIYDHSKRYKRAFSFTASEFSDFHKKYKDFRNGKEEYEMRNERETSFSEVDNKTQGSNPCYCSTQQTMIINRATIMFMIVTLVTILSYIPLWIFVLMDVVDPKRWFVMPDAQFHFFFFLRALSVTGYLSNPIIYAYYDKKFRGVCMKMFCRIFQKCYSKQCVKKEHLKKTLIEKM